MDFLIRLGLVSFLRKDCSIELDVLHKQEYGSDHSGKEGRLVRQALGATDDFERGGTCEGKRVCYLKDCRRLCVCCLWLDTRLSQMLLYFITFCNFTVCFLQTPQWDRLAHAVVCHTRSVCLTVTENALQMCRMKHR